MPGKVKTSKARQAAQQKKAAPAAADPLFPARPKNMRIGGDIRPKMDMSRFVRWPRYIRLQRQRKILKTRLKVPPAINQFTNTLDKNQATTLFKLLSKYRPETKAAKKDRLRELAKAQVEGKEAERGPKPKLVKFGINHVTTLVEQKKAKLVVISHDVDPIELVVWLPALCRKMDVPYCIVKGRARLGALVHHKNATCAALTDVEDGDKRTLDQLADAFKAQFNNNTTVLRQWGGGIVGLKTQRRLAKRERAVQSELAKKALM